MPSLPPSSPASVISNLSAQSPNWNFWVANAMPNPTGSGIVGIPSPYTLAQWGHQENLDPATYTVDNPEFTDPTFGVPAYTWKAPDGEGAVNMYRDDSGGYVYDLRETGGTNLILQSAVNTFTDFAAPIDFQADVRISEYASQAWPGYSNDSIFEIVNFGFFVMFNAKTAYNYDSALPTFLLFLQVPISQNRPVQQFLFPSNRGMNLTGQGSGDQNVSGEEINSTVELPLQTDGGPLHHIGFTVNDYLVSALQNSYVVDAATGAHAGIPAYYEDLSRWSLTGIYDGIEVNPTTGGGPYGVASLGLTIANISAVQDTSTTFAYTDTSFGSTPTTLATPATPAGGPKILGSGIAPAAPVLSTMSAFGTARAATATLRGTAGSPGLVQWTSAGGTTMQALVAQDGTWSITVPVAWGPPGTLQYEDRFGNWSSGLAVGFAYNVPSGQVSASSIQGTISASLGPLQPTIIDTTVDAFYFVTVTGSAGANASVTLASDGLPSPVVVVADGTGAWSYRFAAAQGAATGTHTLTASVSGPSGIVASTTPTSFAVGPAPPAPAIINFGEKTDGSAYTLTGTGRPGDTISVQGSTVMSSVGTDGNWSMDIARARLVDLNAGPLVLTSSDSSGQAGPATTIQLSNGASGSTVTYSDENGLTHVLDISADGQELGQTVYGEPQGAVLQRVDAHQAVAYQAIYHADGTADLTYLNSPTYASVLVHLDAQGRRTELTTNWLGGSQVSKTVKMLDPTTGAVTGVRTYARDDTVMAWGSAASTVVAQPITLFVSEDLSSAPSSGDIQFIASVDGRQVGGVMTAHVAHGSDASEPFVLQGVVGAHPRNIQVQIVQGAAASVGVLHIDSIARGDAVHFVGAALQGNGSQTFGIPEADSTGPIGVGADTVSVSVSGDSWLGDPEFQVMVDGHLLNMPTAVSASHLLGQSETFVFRANLSGGPHQISVLFPNRDSAGSTPDGRNLYVQDVSIDGVEASSPTAAFGNRQSIDFATAGQSTADDTLVIGLSEAALSGGAQFAVFIDGVRLGDAATVTAQHRLSEVQDFSLGTLSPGHHLLGIQLLNPVPDFMHPRVISVDSIAYGGHYLSYPSALITSSSVKTFQI